MSSSVVTNNAWGIRPVQLSSFDNIVQQEKQAKKKYQQQRQEEEEDEDLKLALQISMIENQTNPNNNNNNNVQNESLKENFETEEEKQNERDYLIALQLQEQFEAERIKRIHRENQRPEDPLSKVQLISEPRAFDPSYLSIETEDNEQNSDNEEGDFDSENEMESDEDSYESEEDEESQQKEFADELRSKSMPMKPYHESVKTNGRVPAKEFVTKHDSIFDGIRKAEALESIVNSGSMKNLLISAPVFNSLRQENKRENAHQTRVKGNKVDTHTNEQVLDERTRVAVLKMINAGVLKEMNGVINTGKEANVYHSYSADGKKELAIKIFKTTLNEFKNRADYLEGEFRFRRSHRAFHNPRKLIRCWAEKEMRNLKRLAAVGISVPEAILLKDHILVMQFIGANMVKAQNLKDLNVTDEKWKRLYADTVLLMRSIYQDGKLVHGDFSEFNILYKDGKLVVIDVSQAVEHDHPKALEFLRNDCTAITNFYRKRLVPTLTVKELFEFVTDVSQNLVDVKKQKVISKSITSRTEREEEQNQTEEEREKQYLESLAQQRIAEKTHLESLLKQLESRPPRTAEELTDEAVFLKTFIPRTLHQVREPHTKTQQEDLIQKVTGTPEKKN